MKIIVIDQQKQKQVPHCSLALISEPLAVFQHTPAAGHCPSGEGCSLTATMLFGRERLLSPAQLQNLDQHKYSCQSDSILDPYMQPWWNWLVGRCPLWLAPNLITLAGLAVNIVTTLILVYYNPDAKGTVGHREGDGLTDGPTCL